MDKESTTAVVQRYLNALAGDAPAEPIIREMLGRAVRRLERLCANLLHGTTLVSRGRLQISKRRRWSAGWWKGC